ncbi:MAG: hypothetical protein GX808_03125 [Syntrophomonadaceae bacterium]|jgi:cell division protein FtsB|nr:hypothetical protein [Syntrophomonadaceae bacterium]
MNKQKSNRSPGKIFVLVIVGLVLVLSIFPRGKTIYELSLRKDELLQKQQEVEMQNKELSNKLQNIEEPEQIERIAREKLGMIKPGERYIIPSLEE